MDSIHRIDGPIGGGAVQPVRARRRTDGEDGHEFEEELGRFKDQQPRASTKPSEKPDEHDHAHPKPLVGEVGSQLDVTG